MATHLRLGVIVLAACSMPRQRLVEAQEHRPNQGRVVTIPLSQVAQMAVGFEARRPMHPYWMVLDRSQHVLVGKLLGVRDKTGHYPRGASEFEIVDVHKSINGTWTKGMTLVFPIKVKGNVGDSFGLYTSTHQDSWFVPEKLEPAVIDYLASIPDDRVERLHFFLRQIESRHATIALDAYEGLEQTPIKLLTSLRGKLPIGQLRDRLLSYAVGTFDDPPQEVYSFYDQMGSSLLATMARIVGACGTERDALTLEKHIARQPCFRRDALMAAYFVLRGEAGLDRLLQEIEKKRAAGVGDSADMLDLLSASELLCLYEENPIPRQRAFDLAVDALKNAETAAGGIYALATWRQWKTIDQVTALFAPRLNGYDYTRQAILFYLIACAADAQTPYAGKASRKLEDYQQRYDDIYQVAKASFHSKGSAWHKRLTGASP